MGWMDESLWAWGLMMAYTCAFSMKKKSCFPPSYAAREMSATALEHHLGMWADTDAHNKDGYLGGRLGGWQRGEVLLYLGGGAQRLLDACRVTLGCGFYCSSQRGHLEVLGGQKGDLEQDSSNNLEKPFHKK